MTQTTLTLTPKDYKSEVKPTWCPGCGDFGVLNAIYNSLAVMKLPPDETVVVSGIGCSSRLPHFVQTFGIHSLHGRALPVAQGLKMARPDLTVLAVGGDGDMFSIGAGHLIHAALRNIDITVVVMDNETYGLTKGPDLAHLADRTHHQIDALWLAGLAVQPDRHRAFAERQFCGAGLLLQTERAGRADRTGHPAQRVLLHSRPQPMPNVLQHDGCLEDDGDVHPADHDTHNRFKAMELSMETEKPFVGLFYQEERPTMDQAAHQITQQAKRLRHQ